MTGDARGEAERVAHYYLRMIERASTGSNRQAHRDELVAALAAAIEYRRAKHEMDEATASNDLDANHAAYERACEAGPRMDQALRDLGVDLDTEGDA